MYFTLLLLFVIVVTGVDPRPEAGELVSRANPDIGSVPVPGSEL